MVSHHAHFEASWKPMFISAFTSFEGTSKCNTYNRLLAVVKTGEIFTLCLQR